MRRRRTRRPLAGLLLSALLLAGCGGQEQPGQPRPAAPASTGIASTAEPGAGPTPSPAAAPAPTRPERGTCATITYDQAVAPVDPSTPTSCRAAHTAETFATGELRTIRAGHLLAVDSPTVQRQVARTCPQRLQQYVGGTEEAVRLSMLRAVWFTPTVEESDAGATWFRCDVVVLAGEDGLAEVRGRLDDVLATQEGRDRLGMCGTAAPGSPDFRRTVCRAPHTWRAIATVDLLSETTGPAAGAATPRGGAAAYPGLRVVREAGQQVCDERGQEVAADALDYQWGYEWPTAEQWATGQTYGRCWAPVA